MLTTNTLLFGLKSNLLSFSYKIGWIVCLVILFLMGALSFTLLGFMQDPTTIKVAVTCAVGAVFLALGSTLIIYKQYLRSQLSYIYKNIGVSALDTHAFPESEFMMTVLVVSKILYESCKLFATLAEAKEAVLAALKYCVVMFVQKIDADAFNRYYKTDYKLVWGYCRGGYICVTKTDHVMKGTLVHEIFERLINEKVFESNGLDAHQWMKLAHIEDEEFLMRMYKSIRVV